MVGVLTSSVAFFSSYSFFLPHVLFCLCMSLQMLALPHACSDLFSLKWEPNILKALGSMVVQMLSQVPKAQRYLFPRLGRSCRGRRPHHSVPVCRCMRIHSSPSVHGATSSGNFFLSVFVCTCFLSSSSSMVLGIAFKEQTLSCWSLAGSSRGRELQASHAMHSYG